MSGLQKKQIRLASNKRKHDELENSENSEGSNEDNNNSSNSSIYSGGCDCGSEGPASDCGCSCHDFPDHSFHKIEAPKENNNEEEEENNNNEEENEFYDENVLGISDSFEDEDDNDGSSEGGPPAEIPSNSSNSEGSPEDNSTDSELEFWGN